MQRTYTTEQIQTVQRAAEQIQQLTGAQVVIMSVTSRKQDNDHRLWHTWEIVYTATPKQQQLIDLLITATHQPKRIEDRRHICTYASPAQ